MLRVKSDPARFFIKKNSDSQLVGRDPKVGREDSKVSYKMQFIFTQTFITKSTGWSSTYVLAAT